MEIYISILLYLVTFGLCVWLDLKPNASNGFRKFFIVWLYVFLCFGYMTGSDWRSYEPDYGDSPMYYAITESVFYYCFFGLSKVIPDYWLAVGLLKMLYLHSFFKVVRSYTDKYLFVTAVVFQTLLFMLIDNPLRYMVALTCVNYGLYFYNTKRISFNVSCFIIHP